MKNGMYVKVQNYTLHEKLNVASHKESKMEVKYVNKNCYSCIKVICLCTLVMQPNRHTGQHGLFQTIAHDYEALLQIPSW